MDTMYNSAEHLRAHGLELCGSETVCRDFQGKEIDLRDANINLTGIASPYPLVAKRNSIPYEAVVCFARANWLDKKNATK